jgi:predicted ester cyclase
MKKFLFTAATGMLCFFISCKDSTSTTSSSNSSQNDSNLANSRKVMKAIETGDSATINALIADDAVDHAGPNGQDVKGGDSVKHMLIDIHNHMKDMKLDVIADAANGDYIFSLTTFKGTCTDGNMGMPAGTQMNERGVEVAKVKDGKMVEHWTFVDQNEMMKHMQDMQGGHMNSMGGDKMNGNNMNSGKMDSSKMNK